MLSRKKTLEHLYHSIVDSVTTDKTFSEKEKDCKEVENTIFSFLDLKSKGC